MLDTSEKERALIHGVKISAYPVQNRPFVSILELISLRLFFERVETVQKRSFWSLFTK